MRLGQKAAGDGPREQAILWRNGHACDPDDLPVSNNTCNFENGAFIQGMFPYMTSAISGHWQPGPYPGVDLLTLHKNDQTGGITILRRFHAGITVPAHIHPQANEFVYVLSGEWEEAGVTHTTGAFFFAPRGTPHGPHVARTEVISLTLFDGPLTVVNA
jgi:quercetin dioxygenase-like cupin family protein